MCFHHFSLTWVSFHCSIRSKGSLPRCSRSGAYLIVSQLSTGLNDVWGKRFGAIYDLIPTKLTLLNPDTTDKIFCTYANDLTERVNFYGEIVWKSKWKQLSSEKPSTLQDTLCLTNKELYPNVTAILTILLTISVSTATPERSFSCMRRGKTY